MSHITLKIIREKDSMGRDVLPERNRVFWLLRDPLECGFVAYGKKFSAARKALLKLMAYLRSDAPSLSQHLQETLEALEKAAEIIKQLKKIEAHRDQKDFPMPLVRYGLVNKEHGRDDGVGRVANRWIECALDACRLRLSSQDGWIADTFLSPVLNTSTGVGNYLSYHELNAPTRRERVRHEYHFVQYLFSDINPSDSLDGGNPQSIWGVANLFIELLERQDIDKLANWFEKDIHAYRSKYPEHFENLSLRKPRNFSLVNLRTVLKRKLAKLHHRLGVPCGTTENLRASDKVKINRIAKIYRQ